MGLSRFMASDASVSTRQILLVNHPGTAHLGFDTPVQFKEAMDTLLQAGAFLQSRHASWYAANSTLGDGDPPAALCAWRDRCHNIRSDARAAGVFKWTEPAIAFVLPNDLITSRERHIESLNTRHILPLLKKGSMCRIFSTMVTVSPSLYR